MLMKNVAMYEYHHKTHEFVYFVNKHKNNPSEIERVLKIIHETIGWR